MKIMIARLNHETNTFSPIKTTIKSFGSDGPLYGETAYTASKNTRTGIAAFIDVLEAAGHNIVVACSATSNPSGTVCAQA
ncbi:MAG: M81 family metallopeptidase, partial [Burkholderiaceae bacterium]